MPTTTTTTTKQKRTNSRPCDACAVRRVRCDLQSSLNYRCTNCTNHNIECTNIRVRHKSGPKKIKDKTRENIKNLVNGSANLTAGESTGTGSGLDLFSGSQLSYQMAGDLDSATSKLITLNYSVPRQPYCLNQLLPYLQIYQTWFYGIWPVLSVANLIARLSNPEDGQQQQCQLNGQIPSISIFSNSDPINLNASNAPSYALSCAVNAAIARHKVFLRSTSTIINLVNCPSPKEFADEAVRVLYLFDLRAKPCVETLLSSMFLHIYYGNCPNEEVRGLMYIREAVTIAQILKFHDPAYVLSRPSAESHRIRKIYFLLLMLERFFSLESQYFPVLLEPSIPIPNLKDEEYPEILHGFIEINRVFAATDKLFFQEISQQKTTSAGDLSAFLAQSGKPASDSATNLREFFNSQQTCMSPDSKRQWLQQLQSKLALHTAGFSQIQNDTQRVNILLSKAWFKSLAWLISSQNYLISDYSTPNTSAGDDDDDDCFNMEFPLKIANEFLASTSQSSDFAFEQNGPGVAYKLLEIANSVYTFTLVSDETNLAFDQLNTLHHMIMKFKVDMEITNPILQKITDALELRRFGANYRELSDGKLYELQEEDNNNEEDEELLTMGPATRSGSTSSSAASVASSLESVLEEMAGPANAVSTPTVSYSTTNLVNLINFPSGDPGMTPSFSPAGSSINNLLAGSAADVQLGDANGNRGLSYYLSPFLQGYNGN
ncbi:hypothetical protein WICPIJ_002524 [Wickerhamomyces pijperi]|uniref:Zn(2)-C6 fungal-type domain-containing protein n=1 Tax=Wickerhamomyces pijperi TaxID=599730 RepID=A0A9P8Q8T9_WICPI|nr:hypothetical protein WICPIJ_002524 [Wickerhamomyces pijperi]